MAMAQSQYSNGRYASPHACWVIIAVEMTKDIIAKMRDELDKGVDSEVQVVYLMAAIRKLIERDGCDAPFGALPFHCNWVLHSKLDQSAAVKLLLKFDAIVGAEERQDYALVQTLWQEVETFTDGNRLRAQLQAFLNKYGLPENLCTDDGKWQEFFKEYAAVVSDIPLQVDIPVTHIRKLVLRRADTIAPMIQLLKPSFELGFGIEWHVTRMNGQESPLTAISFAKATTAPPPPTAPQTPVAPVR